MANKPKYMRTALDRAVAQLQELEQSRPLTTADLREQAQKSGYSTRHIQRALDKAATADAAPKAAVFSVTEAVITAVFLACGVLAQAYQLLADTMPLPS